MLPDNDYAPWLIRDISALTRAYVHSIVPDIELTRRFGSADMIIKFKEIADDYDKLTAAAKTVREKTTLKKQMDEDFRNLAAIRDRLRGKRVVCLDIPDDYAFMQPELVALLEKRVGPHLCSFSP